MVNSLCFIRGPWDLEISSNAFSSESVIPSPSILPPHPEIELMRYQLVVKLRQCYQQSCQSRGKLLIFFFHDTHTHLNLQSNN